jgi:hypothetical protein
MNLTAHPLTVAAELAWKRESLSHANLAGESQPSEPRRWRLPRLPRWRPATGQPRRRPRRRTSRSTPRPA